MHFAPLPYLDPGSGSLLIQILLATLLGIGVAMRYAWSKIKERNFTMSTNTQRVVIFVLPGIAEIVMALVRGFGFGNDLFIGFIVLGIEGLILYEIMSRTQVWVRLITLPIYGVIYLVIRIFVGTLLFGLWYRDSSTLGYLFTLDNYSYAFSDTFTIIVAAIMVLVVYFLISGNTISLPGIGKLGGQSIASDKVMLEISDDLVTRLLCASAITQGAAFRKKVLDRVENPYISVAPEFGLDLELVTGVCQFIERRETKFQIAFFVAGFIGAIFSLSPLGFLPMVVFTAPIMFIKIYNEKFDLLKDFTGQNYDREKVKSRYAIEKHSSINKGLPAPNQNLVAYAGFSPFVGAGFDLGGWSFALDISRPKLENDQSVDEFEVGELYKEFEEACTNLNLPSLRVADICFVSGSDIRNDRVVLPDPIGKPIQYVDKDYLKSADDFRIRHFKHLSVSAWGNDIVFSIFLRCAKKGKTLFVEAARYLLPPVDIRYRNLNQSIDKSLSAIFGIVLSSLVLGPINGYFTWIFLLGKFMSFVGQLFGLRDRKTRNEIKKNPNFNYGATSSLRQEVTGANYLHYFQKSDREMFVKLLDNQILETLISFLNEHNIDTSQLRERQTTISNNNVIVHGNIEGQSIAVGEGAQATVNQNKKSSRKE